MKLEEKIGDVYSCGIRETGEMKIKLGSKIFDAISSKIYSEKFVAIMRELGCNAFDSHVTAGKRDVPFLVHLPTNFNPVLAIQDYGLGLSQDEVENIYSTYFDSSKSDSNDVVGCFGIGSKSPFAYSDSFQLVAIKDGIKCDYSLMINENGVPTRNLLNKSKTSEENGVKVIIPVKSSDNHKFAEAARKVFQHFPVKPKFIGQTVTFDNKVPGTSTKDYDLWVSNDSYYARRTIYAIMGNVLYPVNTSPLDQLIISKFNLLPIEEIILKFNIGELEPALSREHLEYKKLTVDSLNKKLGDFIATHVDELKKKLNAQPDMLNAIKFYEANIGFLTGTKPTFDGKLVVPNFNLTVFADNKAVPPTTEKRVTYYRLNYNGNLEEKVSYSTINVTEMLDPNATFIHNDAPKKGGIKPRIKFYLQGKGNSRTYIVYLLEDEHVNKIDKELGGSYNKSLIQELSAFPTPPKTPRGATPKLVQYWVCNGSRWDRHSVKPAGGIYQPIADGRSLGISGYYVEKAQRHLKIEVFGTNVEETKRIVTSDKWTLLKDYIEKELDNHKDEIDFDVFANSPMAKTLLELFQFGPISDVDADVIELHEIAEKLKKNEARLKKESTYTWAQVEKWKDLETAVGKTVVPNASSLEKSIDTKLKALYNKFPLLGILTGKLSDKTIISKELSDYIKLKAKAHRFAMKLAARNKI